HVSKPYADSGCFSPEIRSMVLAAEFIRQHVPPGDPVLAWRASAVALLSGHLSESAHIVAEIPTGAMSEALRSRHIRYILLTADSDFERGPFARAALASCAGLRTDARFPAGTLLLRTADASDRDVTDACSD